MSLFDHLFRSNGTQGTQRWAENPVAFEIWTRRYDCRAAGDSDTCTELLAEANNIPNTFEAHVRNAIAAAGPLCSRWEG